MLELLFATNNRIVQYLVQYNVQSISRLHFVLSGSDGDSLTHLDLGGSNFSSLPPLLISNSLAGLAHLNLYYTKLSTNQMTEVIVGASRSASLQYLDVGANKVNKFVYKI